MRLYEGISSDMNNKINEKLARLESDRIIKITTPAERQYNFLTFLQPLPISKKYVFDIYTNTKLK